MSVTAPWKGYGFAWLAWHLARHAPAAATTAAAANPAAAALQGVAAARFDPTTLGEKLLNAARDGVERIGTQPAGGGIAVAGAAGQNASINDNLKKMGNFFRRDNFGLGARFGKRDGSVEER